MMPSNSIIKRTALCTKYNFDIWGKCIGDDKFLGLMNRLYLSPRFMLEVKNGLTRYRFVTQMQEGLLKYKFSHFFWRNWKRQTNAVLFFRDPYPAYDRPKNMTQVLKKRSMHNFLHLKNLRLRLFLGYKKEYQYRQYLLKARNFMSINFTEKMFLYLEGNVSHQLQRFGFAKNAEIAHELMRNGHIRVNYVQKVFRPHQIKTWETFRVKIPKWQQASDTIQNVIKPLYKISHPNYLIINWKLNTVRFVGKPKAPQFSHPHINLSANDVSFYYSH